MSLLSRLLKRPDPAVVALYRSTDYLTAYRTHTNQRVAIDPQTAIGGLWETVGPLQFEFLKRMGLKPSDRVLDIGCGTLRGGRLVIPYLEPGRYTGTDLSPACIDAAEALVEREGLRDKRPRLLVSDGTLRFEQFPDRAFDCVLAQSVFTHLPEPLIRECLTHVGRILAPGASLFATYRPSTSGRNELRETDDGPKNWAHTITFFRDEAHHAGLRLEEVQASEYPHPRRQQMLRFCEP